MKISPKAVKDNESSIDDDCTVTDRDLIEYLRNICCEANVYTPKSDFHINLPKVFNRLHPSLNSKVETNKLNVKNKNTANNTITSDEETSSVKVTKRVINDLYWDLGWLDPSNFIYYETSVFFDNEQKPNRLSYYEFYIEFIQSLIEKQVYNTLFDYFHYHLSILARGDRYLPKKIFKKNYWNSLLLMMEKIAKKEKN